MYSHALMYVHVASSMLFPLFTQGFTTYNIYDETDIRDISYFWKILEQCFSLEVKSAVKVMRMSKDSTMYMYACMYVML